MARTLSKHEIIRAAEDYFTARGFRNENNRFVKNIDGLKLCFWIQGSPSDDCVFFARTGIYITEIEQQSLSALGHFYVDIHVEKKSAAEIFCAAQWFFDTCGNWKYLYNMTCSNYEDRAFIYMDFHAEKYLFSKIYNRYLSLSLEEDIEELIKHSRIDCIRNDRLCWFDTDGKKEKNAEVLRSMQEYRSGKRRDIFKIRFTRGNNNGVLLIRNCKVLSIKCGTKKVAKTDMPWHDFCMTVRKTGFTIVSDVKIDRAQRLMKITGFIEQKKHLMDFELILCFFTEGKTEFHCYLNDESIKKN